VHSPPAEYNRFSPFSTAVDLYIAGALVIIMGCKPPQTLLLPIPLTWLGLRLTLLVKLTVEYLVLSYNSVGGMGGVGMEYLCDTRFERTLTDNCCSLYHYQSYCNLYMLMFYHKRSYD